MRRASRKPSIRDLFYQDNRKLIAVIADEATTVGFLLAGTGECVTQCNYMIVKENTPPQEIVACFTRLYTNRNIGVILIDRDLLHIVSPVMLSKQQLPIVLDITTKRAISRDKHAPAGMQR